MWKKWYQSQGYDTTNWSASNLMNGMKMMLWIGEAKKVTMFPQGGEVALEAKAPLPRFQTDPPQIPRWSSVLHKCLTLPPRTALFSPSSSRTRRKAWRRRSRRRSLKRWRRRRTMSRWSKRLFWTEQLLLWRRKMEIQRRWKRMQHWRRKPKL